MSGLMQVDLGGFVATASADYVPGGVTNKLTNLAGWFSGASVRTELEDRPQGDGAFAPGQSFRSGKVMQMQGVIIAATAEMAEEEAWDRISAISPEGWDVELNVTSASGTRHMTVRVSGIPEVEPFAPRKARYNIPIVAANPKKFGPARSILTGLQITQPAGAGLVFPLFGSTPTGGFNDHWNPGAEGAANAQADTGGGTVSLSTDSGTGWPVAGTRSFKLTMATTALTTMRMSVNQNRPRVNPGDMAVVSAHIRLVSAGARSVQVFLRFYDTAGATLGTVLATFTTTLSMVNAQVARMSASGVAPAGSASYDMLVGRAAGGSSADVVYADQIRLTTTKLPIPPAHTDPLDGSMAGAYWLNGLANTSVTRSLISQPNGGLLDFGNAPSGGTIQVTNAGKAPTFPVFTIFADGGLPGGFEIVDAEGGTLRYPAAVDAGSTLVIDMANRRVLADGQNDFTTRLTRADKSLAINGGQSKTYRFRALGGYVGNPTLTVTIEDAWW